MEADAASTLEFINRQRTRRLELARLRRQTEGALARLGVQEWNLTFYFVGARKMAALNATQLGHDGPTDVITFDYAERPASSPKSEARTPKRPHLHGEIFICVDVAVAQARAFRTTWQAEVLRYLIHGCLHLCGYDDLTPAARRVMKRVEDRLVRQVIESPRNRRRSRPRCDSTT
ncbi:MAG: rRNA maturation RNase YbeY [Limisphaerales bacterium]